MLLSALAFCTATAAPTEQQLQAVPVDRVIQPGAVVPGTPSELNASISVRYGPAKPQRVLLLMPGYLGGAGDFDRLARQLVVLDPGLAVWAVDRRANLLEQRDQLENASDAELARIVRDGGLLRRPITEVSYMTAWGLDTTLKDWRVAVQGALTRTPNGYSGRQSLGGVLTGLYAAYDFAGQPGYKDVRGLILLDGYPGLLSSRPVTWKEYQGTGTANEFGNLPGLSGLEDYPYVNTVYFGPRLASQVMAQARLAVHAPTAQAPQSSLALWPMTNQAAAMIKMDARYSLVPFLTLNSGHATNVNEAGRLLPRLLGSNGGLRITGPKDPHVLIGWQDDPDALTASQTFLTGFSNALGDGSEWYFPMRLVLDVAAAGIDTTGTAFQEELPVIHNREVNLPVLGIAAGSGVAREKDFKTYVAARPGDLTFRSLPGAAHLDILTAKSDQVAGWIVDWLSQHK
ncbi:alpha/beta hydrolase [Deinococcus sp.]|uniref:alpha/beta hydrolase n=1 Tax=Deinococcus sp. TaxID=47478 RepID=UPI0025C5C647|nr:alpha/beta hydrolase [Deinococcus sp.]